VPEPFKRPDPLRATVKGEGLLTVHTSPSRGGAVVRADGESHAADSGRLETELLAACRNNRLVVLDCSGLTFLSSAALAVVVATHNLMAVRGHRLRLVVNTPAVGAVLRVSGLDGLLPVFCSLGEAFAAGG
jgi:anti-anti-sigma factor